MCVSCFWPGRSGVGCRVLGLCGGIGVGEWQVVAGLRLLKSWANIARDAGNGA